MARLTDNELQDLLLELSNKQIRFCEILVRDDKLNKAEVAIEAGYAVRGAAQETSRQLKKVKIQRYVAHLKFRRSERTGITSDRVVKELAKIAFSDVSDIFEISPSGALVLKELDSIKNPGAIKDIDFAAGVTKLKLHDKLKALELLGRHTAAFTENINLTNNGGDLPEAAKIDFHINHRARGENLEDEK